MFSGFLLGAIAGVLGVISHAGPVDQPLVGLVVAFALVSAGSWLAVRSGGRAGWFGYTLAVAGTTAWLMFFPSAGDIFLSTTGWASEAWLILMAIAVVSPMAIVAMRSKTAPRE